MKKYIITVFSVLISVLLCSCGGAPDAADLSKVFSAPYETKIAVNDGENVYTASVTYDGETLVFRFAEPGQLCGVSYEFTDGKGSIVYDGLRVPVDLNGSVSVLSGGVFIWKDLLKADGEYTVRRVNEGQSRLYVATDGETEYRFDAETRAPVFIKSGDITITFTDFRVKNGQTSESAG